MRKNSNIVLIGFMGVGKDTIGKILANNIGYKFVATDDLVQEQKGMSLTDILQTQDEAAIHDAEYSVLLKLLDDKKRKMVISTGGDIVLSEKNREILRKLGFVILLNTHQNEIIERMKKTPNKRYQFVDFNDQKLEEEIIRLMKSRQELYNSIKDAEIDTYEKSPMETVSEIMELI